MNTCNTSWQAVFVQFENLPQFTCGCHIFQIAKTAINE